MSIKVCDKAPDFRAEAVIGKDFKIIELKDYLGKYLVLLFYPLDFTFVCPTEIIAFNDALEEFQRRNSVVLGVSVDSKFAHLAWKNTARSEGGIGDIRFPLIADLTKQIARDYDVLIEELGYAARGLFVIDADGIVKHITVNHPDFGRNVDEVLRIIDAVQYAEEHGEVCPVNWKKGNDTISPDPEHSKIYFSKHG